MTTRGLLRLNVSQEYTWTLDRCLDIMNQDCIRHSTLSTVREPHFRFSCSTRFSLTPNNHTDRDLDITYYDCIRYTLSEPQLQYKIQCQQFEPQPQSAYVNPKILFHMRVVTIQWSRLSSVTLYCQVSAVLMICCKNYIQQKVELIESCWKVFEGQSCHKSQPSMKPTCEKHLD